MNLPATCSHGLCVLDCAADGGGGGPAACSGGSGVAQTPSSQTFTVEVRFRLALATDTDNDVLKHTVHRRYRQFAALSSVLRARYPGVPPLPGKHLFASRTEEFLRKRAAELDAFLSSLVAAPFAVDCEDLGAFLGVGESLRTAAPRWLARLARPGEPPAAKLARGLGQILYVTKSLCPTCVGVDRTGRGTVWHSAVVAQVDQVRPLPPGGAR